MSDITYYLMPKKIPIQCQLCSLCQREQAICSLEPDKPFINIACEEFKFYPPYLVDYLEAKAKEFIEAMKK